MSNGIAEVAKALLEKDADVHTKTSGGETALLWACEMGHDDVPMILLEMGAVEWVKGTLMMVKIMDLL